MIMDLGKERMTASYLSFRLRQIFASCITSDIPLNINGKELLIEDVEIEFKDGVININTEK